MLKPYVDTIKIPTKTDFVVDTLRTAILTGEILPGTRITEQEVRNWVKVSSVSILLFLAVMLSLAQHLVCSKGEILKQVQNDRFEQLLILV